MADSERPTKPDATSGEIRTYIKLFESLDKDISTLSERVSACEETLIEHKVSIEGLEDKVTSLEAHFAKLDSISQTFENQIQIFRDAVREEIRRFKAGIK